MDTDFYLPFLDVRPQIQFIRKCCPWLSMQMPVRVGNLRLESAFPDSPLDNG